MDQVAGCMPDPSPDIPDMRVVLRTPYAVVADTHAKEVIAPAHGGMLLLRAGMPPLLTALQPGTIVLRHGHGAQTCIDASWGLVTFSGDEIRFVVRHAAIRGAPQALWDEHEHDEYDEAV